MELIYSSFLILIGIALILTMAPWQSLIGVSLMIILATSVITYARPKIVFLSEIIRDKGFQANRAALYALSGAKDALVSGRQKYFVSKFIKTYYKTHFTRARLILVQKAVPLALLLEQRHAILKVVFAVIL